MPRAKPFAGKKILVVDDETDLREIIADELVMAGATVVQAGSGNQANRLLDEGNFAVVVSDIRMPDGDGVSVLRHAKRAGAGPSPVVILITGFADLALEEAFDLGAEAYFTKPFPFDELLRVISLRLADKAEAWGHLPAKPPARALPPLQLDSRHVGRGGFFFPDQVLERGGNVSFEVTSGNLKLKGQGIVCWHRNRAEGELGVGSGVEISYLEPSSLAEFQAFLEQAPRAFIPHG